MKSLLIRLAILTVVSGLASSVHAQKDSSAEAAIRAADQGWERVFGAKDLKASVMFCAPDASFMAPNAPIAMGRDAIGKAFAGFFALPEIKLTWHPTKVEVSRSGELGYSTGVYEMSFKDPSGKTASDHGKYVTLWRKQSDGSWKVIYDIFNSDVSATP